MGALVMVESCILALTTGTALAQSLSTTSSTRAGPIGICTGASYPEIRAVWPARGLISEAAPAPVRPFAFTRVDINIGPLIDMDNSRRQDEDRQKKRQKELREQAQREESRRPYGSYGYAYPPSTYAYPPQDLYHYNYSNNRYYYDPLTGYYYQPSTGQYYYIRPGSGPSPSNNGHSRDGRPENTRSVTKEKSMGVGESGQFARILPGEGHRS
jgi:hypothetical protein